VPFGTLPETPPQTAGVSHSDVEHTKQPPERLDDVDWTISTGTQTEAVTYKPSPDSTLRNIHSKHGTG
jgi:hypothetical protein